MNKPVQTDSIFSRSSGGQTSETGPGLQSKPQQGFFVLKTLGKRLFSFPDGGSFWQSIVDGPLTQLWYLLAFFSPASDLLVVPP